MMKNRGIGLGPVLLCLLSLLLGACAGPNYSLQNPVDAIPLDERPTWPRGGETARYRLAGLYYGEQNLNASFEDDASAAFTKALYWVAGVFQDNTSRQLQSPQGVLSDELGALYVADVGWGGIFVFDPLYAASTGGALPIWTRATPDGERFITPVALVKASNGDLLVTDADLGLVARLDREGQPKGTFGKGVLNRPTGIARDPARGRIYVADTQDHDIKVFSDKGELLDTFGQRGVGAGEFNFPIHLAFARNRLHVVDSMNARIQVFDTEGEHLLSFGKRGRYLGDFTRPKGIAVDSQGHVYVSDSFVDSVLVFDAEGRFLLPIGGSGARAVFQLPAGIFVDDRDRVFISDLDNGRVVALDYLGGS
ncbi:6-bladed beta-propeller [Motiliproteus sp. SC1-56]|uniref:6-bladed beta-propeller n=1 Tax=Motiliproteus sp. SC1-56 TaxID=2799565 RepID=UPI001A8D69FD|nr:6-bladed beta-propeller [Motiliproteus sp. SC1-56]